jgi:hypothetical protein
MRVVFGTNILPSPRLERSPDPTDDFPLALSQAGKADYLVTGDKSGLLSLARHAGRRIMRGSRFGGFPWPHCGAFDKYILAVSSASLRGETGRKVPRLRLRY